MTGPEHYREAERLLDQVTLADDGEIANYSGASTVVAAAQVHATLAQVSYLREIGDQLDSMPRGRATDSRPEQAWIIRATWVNSSNTFHGPFEYGGVATTWAQDEFADDDSCTSYEIGVLTPPMVLG